MCRFKNYISSTIGKKHLVGLTGLGLSGFVLVHMSGNLLLLVGPETYNVYAHKMVTNPLLYFMEASLLLLFMVHIGLAVQLSISNRQAQGEQAGPATVGEKAARFGSRSMIVTGLLIFVFTVLHLLNFKYGAHYTVTYGSAEMRDLYRLVLEKFQSPLYVGWYCFSLVVLGIHLSHGFSAAFQSLGLFSVRNCLIKKAGYLFAGLVALGFISQPIVLYFCRGIKP